jgi:hypothetical protein
MRSSASIAAVASLLLAGALSAGGCGGKAKAAPQQPTNGPAPATMTDAELEATMQAGLAFIVELGDDLAGVAGQDCATIAATIEATTGRHGDVIEASARVDKDPATKARADAWMSAHEAELTAAAEKIGPSVAPCTDDAAVQAAVEKLSPP